MTAFPSSFAPAGRAVVEGLALPFLKAPLLRWGPSCAVGYGGRPSVPPLRRFAGRRNRRIRKAMPYKRSPLQSGRVRTPAPTADVKAFLFFRRGRTLAGPLKGFCHSGPTLIRLAYARHLLPMKGEGFRAADSRSYSPPEASRGAYHAPAVNTHRERWFGKLRRGNRAAKPGIFANPGPSGPAEMLDQPLRFCAPEIFCPSKGVTPVMGDRG